MITMMACGLAGPAGAVVMEAQIHGDWNGNYDYSSWSADIVYDTNRATESVWIDPTGAVGHQLVWKSGEGPSPVVSETVTLEGYKTFQWWMDYDTFQPIPDLVTTDTPTSFTIFQSATYFLVQGYGLAGENDGPSSQPNLGFIPFDQNGGAAIGLYASGPAPGPGNGGAQTYVAGIGLTVIGPSPTPEPATWTMMLGGFFGAGAVVRRRRAQSVYRPA